MRNKSSLFFHSPFCDHFDPQVSSQPIILQFLLTELINCLKNTKGSEKTSSPFYWTNSPSSYEKLKEHSLLLQHFFPSEANQAREIEAIVQSENTHFSLKQARHLFTRLSPFLSICKQNAPFLFFLLRHRKQINPLLYPGNLKTLFHSLHPNGLNTIHEEICNYYQSNGYKNISSQVRKLTKGLL